MLISFLTKKKPMFLLLPQQKYFNYYFRSFFLFILNAVTELLVTLWLHYEDDVSKSPFLSVFLKVTIFQVPSSAVSKSQEPRFYRGSCFCAVRLFGYTWLHFFSPMPPQTHRSALPRILSQTHNNARLSQNPHVLQTS